MIEDSFFEISKDVKGFDEVHKIDHKPSAHLKYYFGFFVAI